MLASLLGYLLACSVVELLAYLLTYLLAYLLASLLGCLLAYYLIGLLARAAGVPAVGVRTVDCWQ